MRTTPTMLLVGLTLLTLGVSARTHAEGALTVFGGANIGGDLNLVASGGDLDLQSAIKNSPLFGVRVGSYGFPIGFEGSLTYSPSAIIGGINDQLEIETNILYVETNAIVTILPGPIAPFVTGGVGVHYLSFNLADLTTTNQTKFGWNLGGGLKINVERVAFRIDIRDHVTTLGVNDFGFGIIGDILGVANAEARVHNVELSFGVGIRF